MKSRILRILGFAMILTLLVCVIPAHADNEN